MGQAEDEGDAEGPGQDALLVGEEGEGKVVFLLEAELRGRTVRADADDAHAARLEGGEVVAQAAGLGGAAGGIGFGVEIDEGEAALVEVGEANLAALFVARGGVGRGVAELEGFSVGGEAEPGEESHEMKLN